MNLSETLNKIKKYTDQYIDENVLCHWLMNDLTKDKE